jgi:hypothetical protein
MGTACGDINEATPAAGDASAAQESGDAAIPARSKKERDPLRNMGANFGVERL